MAGTELGIDMGTANTRIFMDKKIVLNEPTASAYDLEAEAPIAFGEAAAKMVGRTPERIQTISPVTRGVVSDLEMAEQMLRFFLRKICGQKMFKPSIVATIPAGVTAVEHRSYEDVLKSAGARKICFVESSIAAAIGMGVDFSRPHGTIIVDIGEGVTDVAVLSMGGLAERACVKVASGDFDEAIIRHAHRKHRIAIGKKTAESIKLQIGTVAPQRLEVSIKAKGRNLYTGLPEVFEITSAQVQEAISEPLNEIVKGIQSVMERTPPELMADIYTDGVLLAGNGVRLKGLDGYLSERLGVRTAFATDINGCVVKGAGKVLKDINLLANTEYKTRALRDLAVE